MEHTSDGGFKWGCDHYTPFNRQIALDDSELPMKKPHLFYLGNWAGLIVSAHPGIVQVFYQYGGIAGFCISVCGNTSAKSFPAISGDDLYGTDSLYRERDVRGDQDLLHRTLAKIRGEYHEYITRVTINQMMINSIPKLEFVNLTNLNFNDCDLTQMPPLTHLPNICYLSLARNKRLVELPYDFLKYRIGQLNFLNIHDTGIQCIWGRTSMIVLKSRDLVADHRVWLLPKQIEDATMKQCFNPEHLNVLCAQMAEPAVRAAAAVMLVQSRGVLKNFHRDIARLIAEMILETRGRALWRPVYDSMFG